MAIRYRLGFLLALVFLAGSCDDPAEPLPSGVLSVSIDSSAGPIIRVATITLERPAPVDVVYGAPDTPTLRITADSQASVYRIVLPRLRADSKYRLQVGIPEEGGVHETTFGTAPLPADLARIELTITGEPTYPVSLIEIAGAPPGEFTGLLMVEQGEIVGYMHVPGSLFGMTRRANGDIGLMHPLVGLVVQRLDGTVVHQLPSSSSSTAYGRIHHDLTATPSNTILFIAADVQTVDGVAVTGEALWEWSPEAGTVVKRWSAFDHLDWRTERGRESTRSNAGNWLHGNGIQYGPRGNVIMSLRNINQVISIAPDFQSVEWKLGGDNPTLAVPDGDRFFGQHYVSEPKLNHLLVYDNGFERPGCVDPPSAPCYTRAIEYVIDRTANTATKVWEYRHFPDIFAALVGSVRRLPNGNSVVLFGMSVQNQSTGPITAVEVNDAGQVQWRLTVPDTDVAFPQNTPGRPGPPSRLYRLTPIASLLGEVRASFR
ncbi:MAG: aryl-sulfate sulfotransferase [Gemmatimonadaceae bacterium]